MNPIKFGIIGCGTISDWHAQALLSAEKGVLIGVSDVNISNAEKMAAKYHVKAYACVDDMLFDSDIDAVCICTPSGYHVKEALKVMEAGKHVLIEKPLAITDADCALVVQKAREKGICAGVISQCRFSPDVRRLKELVNKGALGKIITVDLRMKYFRSQEYYDSSSWRGTWEFDGGSLMNQGIHGVDVMLYIMGDVSQVFGFTGTLNHTMEAEDTASACIAFKCGALGLVQSTTSVYPGYPRNLVISGTKGTVSLMDDEIVEYNIENEPIVIKDHSADKKIGFKDPKNIGNEGHLYQVNDFIDAIINKKEPEIPLEEGQRTVNVINAVYQSSRTGEKIIFD